MKKRAQHRARRATASAAEANAVVRTLWLRRSEVLLLGAATALLVATPLVPSEAAIPFGSHVVLLMGWLVLGVAWLMRCLLEEKPVWYVGMPGVLFGAFLLVHSLSCVIMMRQGHGRPTLNALWVWLSLGILFLTVRQLVRRPVEQRALTSVLLALAVGLAAFGVYQTLVIYPRLRADYAENPDRVLNDAGENAPYGSPQRRHFEDRLASTEPTSTFALTNSLAGVLAPCTVLLFGLAVPLWRALIGCTRTVKLGILVAGLSVTVVLCVCLLLTKSRTGYVATLAGLVMLGLFTAVPRSWWRLRYLAAAAAAAVVICASVLWIGGLDRQVLTEAPKSLLYRFQYWQASAAMIGDYPLWGCGPGNFKDYYTQYKLPEASETIADPHNFLFEVAATAGLPALALFLLVWWTLLRRGWHSGTSSGEPTGQPDDADDAKPIYVGTAVGILVAYPAGLAGGHPLSLEVLVIVPLVMLLALVTLHRWVTHGALPAGLLIIAVATQLVNLLAAGGISLPGVAVYLWVFSALGLGVTESSREPVADASPGWRGSRVTSRSAIGVALAMMLVLVAWGYVTMYHPVLAGHQYNAQISEISTRASSVGRINEVIEASEAAAQADPWWATPVQIQADAQHHLWIARQHPDVLSAFEAACHEARQRNPQSATLARLQGNWWIEMYVASGRPDLLERAIQAYDRAVQLYPNSGFLQAQLAWARYCAGQARRADRLAARALELDAQMPHEEYQLRNQPLAGVDALRTAGGASLAQSGRDTEQLMHDIRMRNGAWR